MRKIIGAKSPYCTGESLRKIKP